MSKTIYSNEEYKRLIEKDDKGEIKHYTDREKKEYISYENDFNMDQYNKHVGNSIKERYFCVFRVGKKIKDIGQVQALEKHMERQIEVFNADPANRDKNMILIGDKNITQNVKNYIYGIKLRSNVNIARDLVLTSNNDFFKELTKEQQELWIKENIKFLKEQFGDNCLYACLHLDETTPHIHALIVPRFWNEEKKRYELSSNVYFDGKLKMQNWQTQYANHMSKEFNNLMRGVKGSKAKHTDIKTYYSLITGKLDVTDGKQVLAYAQRNFLLEKRVKALELTLEQMQKNEDVENLLNKVDKLNKNNKIYKETIKAITKKYGINEKEILELVDKVSINNVKNNQRER